MVENITQISGKAMAVLIGAICLIGPWLSQAGTLAKILISLIGAVLIYFGVRG